MDPRHFAAAAALTLLMAAPAGAAGFTQTFDTPTSSSAETGAVYGLVADGLVSSARVVDGELRLDAVGGFNGRVAVGAFDGDFGFSFDTRISTSPGLVNVGLYVGSSLIYFHPGYWDRYFLNGTDAGGMGFALNSEQATRVAVDVFATTKTVTVTFSQSANAHSFSFVDNAYVAGVTEVGFTAGSVGGDQYYGVFDNLTTPVPEPSMPALFGIGLAALAMGATRQRGRRSAERPLQPA